MSRTDVPNFEERVQFLKRCTVRSRYWRQLIQLDIKKWGLHGLDCKTRDSYSLLHDSRIRRTHCIGYTLVYVCGFNLHLSTVSKVRTKCIVQTFCLPSVT